MWPACPRSGQPTQEQANPDAPIFQTLFRPETNIRRAFVCTAFTLKEMINDLPHTQSGNMQSCVCLLTVATLCGQNYPLKLTKSDKTFHWGHPGMFLIGKAIHAKKTIIIIILKMQMFSSRETGLVCSNYSIIEAYSWTSVRDSIQI